jgi:hypothetical protein
VSHSVAHASLRLLSVGKFYWISTGAPQARCPNTIKELDDLPKEPENDDEHFKGKRLVWVGLGAILHNSS